MNSSNQYFNVSDDSDNEKKTIRKRVKDKNITSSNNIIPEKDQLQNMVCNQSKQLENHKQTNDENQKQNINHSINFIQSNSIIQQQSLKSVSEDVENNITDQPKVSFKIHLNAFNTVLAGEELKNLAFEDSRHYKVIGENRIFYTRAGNLSQKIKEIHNTKEEQQRLQNLQNKNQQQELAQQNNLVGTKNVSGNNKSDKMDEEQGLDDNFKDLFEYNKNNRYFQQVQKQEMTCRRCKKQGHFERMCMIEVKYTCYYCLGEHLSHDCKQRICFNCNQLGHVSKNCPNNGSMRCARCQKVGHVKADCGAIMFARQRDSKFYYGIEEEWKKTDDQKMKCQICKKKGHLNCKNDYFKNVRDEVYGQKFQDRIKKLRRKEEEAKFKGQIINFHYIDEIENSSSSTCNSHSPSSEKQKNSQKKQNSKLQIKQDHSEDIQIHVEKENVQSTNKVYKKNFKNLSQNLEEKIHDEKQDKKHKNSDKESSYKQDKHDSKDFQEKKDKYDLKNKQDKNQKQNKFDKQEKYNKHEIYDKNDKKSKGKQELSESDYNYFENLFARNITDQENPYGSDIYLSDLNEDHDYSSDNENQENNETRRIKKIKEKKREDDKNRERSKQKARVQESRYNNNNRSNDRNIFNQSKNNNTSSSKSDRYFEFDDSYNSHKHHHKSRSEGRANNNHNYKRVLDHEIDHSAFVDRTENYKKKHNNHHYDENYYQRDQSKDKKQKSFSNIVFDGNMKYKNFK